MQSTEEVRNRLSILDVVRDYGTLHPAGSTGNYKMLCPFHDDHSPSMIVSEAKGLAWCFSCNTGGDMFSFIQKKEGVSFPEAIRILSKKAGISVPEMPALSPKKTEENEILSDIMDTATEFFCQQFWESPKAQAEVAKRNIADATLQTFRIGYAPKAENALEKHLLEKGFSHKHIGLAGLITHKDGSNAPARDKFRDRIMFPIANAHGQICGFGGRYIGDYDKAPKYLNSPETDIYKKSQILYGLDRAKESLKAEKTAFLVEGYFDVLACHNVGMHNVIATSGTACTVVQIQRIRQYVPEIALMLDIDSAGQAAARRIAQLALQAKMNISIVEIPGGKDPDEAIRAGKEVFFHALENRTHGIEAFFARSLRHRDVHAIADKKQILDELLPLLHALPRAIDQDHYRHMLAEHLRISPEVLTQEFSRHLLASPQASQKAVTASEPSALEYFLGMLLAFPECNTYGNQDFLEDLLDEGQEKTIYKHIQQHYTLSADKGDVLASIPDSAEHWNVLSLYAEQKNAESSPHAREKEFLKILARMHCTLIPKKLQHYSLLLQDNQHNLQQVEKYQEKMQELSRILHTFHHS